MIVIEGSVRIPEGKLDEARPAMEAMIRASRAEPGCIDYTYAVDVMDPCLIRVIERWADAAALAAHFQTAHMAQWRMVIPTLGLTDRSLRRYEAEPEDM